VYVQIKGFLRLVIQKSDVITSELEVTFWSGRFQKLCLFLKISFKLPGVAFHSCRAVKNPASHHGVVYQCGVCSVLFVVSRIAVAYFRSEKIQDQVSQKITPKNDYFSVVQSVHWNCLCISQGARPGSTLCCRWDDRKRAADLRCSQSTKIINVAQKFGWKRHENYSVEDFEETVVITL